MRTVDRLLGCCLVLYSLGGGFLVSATPQQAKPRPADRKRVLALTNQIDNALQPFLGQDTNARKQRRGREQLISIVQQSLGSQVLLELIKNESDPGMRLSLQIAVANALGGAQTLLDNRRAVGQGMLSLLRITENNQVAIGLSTGLFNQTLDDVWQQPGEVDPEALARKLFEDIKSASGANFEKVAEVLALETSDWMNRTVINADETAFHRTIYGLTHTFAPQEPSGSEQIPPVKPLPTAQKGSTSASIVWIVFLGAVAYLLHVGNQRRKSRTGAGSAAA